MFRRFKERRRKRLMEEGKLNEEELIQKNEGKING